MTCPTNCDIPNNNIKIESVELRVKESSTTKPTVVLNKTRVYDEVLLRGG